MGADSVPKKLGNSEMVIPTFDGKSPNKNNTAVLVVDCKNYETLTIGSITTYGLSQAYAPNIDIKDVNNNSLLYIPYTQLHVRSDSIWVDNGTTVLNRTVDLTNVDKFTITLSLNPNGEGGARINNIVLK